MLFPKYWRLQDQREAAFARVLELFGITTPMHAKEYPKSFPEAHLRFNVFESQEWCVS